MGEQVWEEEGELMWVPGDVDDGLRGLPEMKNGDREG